MGLFDGLAGRTDTESTAQISGLLRAPVVLVIDVGAMGQSVAALVHGFRAYDELLWLGGVILNRVASSRHEQLLREALDDIGVPVLGALRRRALSDVGLGAPLPSRQHGVAPVAHGSLDAIRAVRRLGEVIGEAVDVERMMALARSAPRLTRRALVARGRGAARRAHQRCARLHPARPAVRSWRWPAGRGSRSPTRRRAELLRRGRRRGGPLRPAARRLAARRRRRRW